MEFAEARKIAIFGWPASGKSTFGKLISEFNGIELYSLDLIRWKYSENGVKDDEKFLNDYHNILKNDSWIIEGNALDFIDSRLEQADLLIFFDSTTERCIKNYYDREARVSSGEEVRINFDSTKSHDEMTSWIENRYSKKIEKLRPVLKNYKEKLIVINDYDELNDFIKKLVVRRDDR